MKNVLLLGSGPNVLDCRDWPRAPFDTIIVINNAWSVRTDWDYLIHPDDFSPERRPAALSAPQQIITSADYVPVQNRLGGFVYAGGTMAFTAAYWALGALRPSTIATLGCDMVYDAAQTHFYGKGTADPLREDVTLRSLEAKSARLMILAAKQGCAMVNLSTDTSRLIFPRATTAQLPTIPQSFDDTAAQAAADAEARLGYMVASGKYWKEEERFDVVEIDALDAAWLKAARRPETSL